MTITTQDIQLYRSQVLDETDQGGGRMSGTQVVDGELNNLFDDQSRLDRVTGRVSLRKAFMAVLSQNVTKLLGAHAILLQRALDPGVHVTMFGRDSHVDRRSAAQAHLEQYLAAGPSTPFFLFETQPEGALSVVMFTAPSNADPAGGDTLVLSVERGTVNLGAVQFVRVVGVATEQITITLISGQSLTVKLVTLTIDQPLRNDFPGETIDATFKNQPRTVVRRTTLAGGKRYYGIHALTAPAAIGETNVQLETILTPVVPSAQQQIGITDQQVGSDGVTVVPIGPPGAPGLVTQAVRGVNIIGSAVSVLTERAITPGDDATTVVIQPTGESSAHRAVLIDDGRGVLVRDASSGASVPAAAAGTISYADGAIVVTGLSVATGTVSAAGSNVVYRPAVALVDAQHTDGIEITAVNRALVYTRTLTPRPSPGALQFAYRALGRWITLRDRGDGTIAGQSGEGSGTINYATGTTNITLGAEPDVGSHVLYAWGTAAHYQGPAGDVLAKVPEAVVDLPLASGQAGSSVLPGSFELTYSIGETSYAATDDGAGNITGDAVGTIDYAKGIARYVLTNLPPIGTVVTHTFDRATHTVDTDPDQVFGGGTLTVDLGGSVGARSLRLSLSLLGGGVLPGPNAMDVRDDGAGNLVTVQQKLNTGTSGVPVFVVAGVTVGTINYGTGEAVIDEVAVGALGITQYSASGAFSGGANWQVQYGNATITGCLTAIYLGGSPTGTETTASPAIDTLSLQLDAEQLLDGIIPGSLLFTFAGRRYYDRGGVVYYRDTNGAEIQAGAVNYETGIITLTSWATSVATATVRGVLVGYGRWQLERAYWRVDAPQLLPGSYQVTYQRFGEEIADSAVSDAAGDIVGEQLVGTVNFQTGVYVLEFAEPVVPETARYNAVSVAFLPLNPAVIGLDPVRLSADGRVPTVQNADVAVIHNTVDTVLPNPVIAGETYETRPSISDLEIRDANNLLIPTDRYDWSKVTGEITMANPLDLDDYEQPLVARHRIEDMLLVTDAQLNGLVGLNSALTHNFPAETSFLSTALILDQELQATAFNVFSQTAWTGVWSDVLIGSSPTGQYNTVVAPLEMTNRGSIRERWRIEFTSVTAFRLIGETVGQVGVGDVNTDFAPINPTTGDPYVTVRAAGWSAGWNIGNQVRFNTEGAQAPIWLNRTTLPGPLTDPVDRVQIALRGDAN